MPALGTGTTIANQPIRRAVLRTEPDLYTEASTPGALGIGSVHNRRPRDRYNDPPGALNWG